MAIIHTPRSLAAIARGMIKRRRALAATDGAPRFVGFAPPRGGSEDDGKRIADDDNAHVYRSRPSVLWDMDYLGHMNNASYLTHAEYARWAWYAENGGLSAMYEHGMHFVATHTAARFRREIGVRDRFEIRTNMEAIDDRHIWIQHTFRSGGSGGRILAQVLLQAMVVKDRRVVPPITLLKTIGVPTGVAESLTWRDKDGGSGGDTAHDDDDATTFLERFRALDEAFRREAAADDERLRSASTEKE